MNPALLTNKAINGFKAIGGDIRQTFTGSGRPLTYALRNEQTRGRMDRMAGGSYGPTEYGPQDKVGMFTGFDGKRVAATAAGAYVAADGAHRMLSGGTAFQDSRGRSDLVGVPFV